MRNDVGALLSKLGRRDLKYHEFADRFGDLELWPIFEALLVDPRVMGQALTRLQARRERGMPPAEPPEHNVHPFMPPRRAGTADGQQGEVRAFLNRLK